MGGKLTPFVVMTATPADGIALPKGPLRAPRTQSGTRRAVRLGDPTAEAALCVVLEALDRPAFVVGPALAIRNANSRGLALLGSERLATLAAIEGELSGAPSVVELQHKVSATRIPCAEESLHLCVVEPLPQSSRAADRVARAAARFGLTRRQAAVLAGVARGASNKQISLDLECSLRTVELHVSALLARMSARNRTMLVALLNEI